MLTGLKHYGWVIRRSIVYILIGVVVCTGITFIINKREAPVYQASALIQINSSITDDNNNVFTDQALAQSYALLINEPQVMQAVAQKFPGVDPVKLADNVSATPQNDTQVIAIQVRWNDPQTTADLANQIAQTFVQTQISKATSQLQSVKDKLTQDLITAKRARDDSQSQLTTLENSHASQDQINRQQDIFNAAQANYNSIEANYDSTSLQLYRVTGGITIVSEAAAPTTTIAPKTTLNTLVAAILSFLLLAILFILLDWLDVSIRTSEDVENLTRLESLGTIPFIATENKEPLSLITTKDDALETAFATIGLNFESIENTPGSVTMTSLQPSVGTTTTAINLALSLTQAGKRVLLVDANFARPALHDVFRRPNTKGLSNSLNEVRMFQEQRMDLVASWLSQWNTQIPNMWMLPTGPKPPTTAMIFRAPELQALISWLSRPVRSSTGKTVASVVDCIIFDTPSLNEGATALELAGVTSGCVLVVEAGKEQVQAIQKTELALRKVHSSILGIVVNRQTAKNRSYLYTSPRQTSAETIFRKNLFATPSFMQSSDETSRAWSPPMQSLPAQQADNRPSPIPTSPRKTDANTSNGQVLGPPLKVEG